MRSDWKKQGLLLGTMGISAAALLAGCGKAAGEKVEKSENVLTIISPHSSDIRREFGDAFSRWHQEHYGTPVEVLWPDVGGGGTGNVIRELSAAYKVRDSSGYDLVFGGGSATFNSFMGAGFLDKPPAMEENDPWKSDPIDAVPLEIFGGPLHGKDGLWVAATMSAFGMEVNPDRIAELHLQTPVTWSDLAGPAWFGRLSLADPSKSGSVRTGFEMVLQANGWEKGWGILTEMFANTAMVRDSGSAPADDVGNADAVAGVVIDFYGRLQVLRVGPGVAAFVVPKAGTALDADPIAMLRGAPHAALGADFERFVVSEEGQKLWTFRTGTPGGPVKTSLGRLSVVEGLYQPPLAENLVDKADPFLMQGEVLGHFDEKGQQWREPFIGDLIKAALIDNRQSLMRARQAIRAAGDQPDLLAKLTTLPTYRVAEVSGGKISYGPETPLDESALRAMHDDYAPAKTTSKAAFQAELQNRMRDFWRARFATRFAEIQGAAGREK